MCKSSFPHRVIAAHTIKIAGLSGSGKSTLIRAYTRQHPLTASMSYGEFLAAHGPNATALWQRYLENQRGLVLMDEHLEYGDADLMETYVRENTRGIFMLAPTVASVLERRRGDSTRVREHDPAIAEKESAKSMERAASLAAQLLIPLHVLRDTTVTDSLVALERFITCVG